MQEYISTHSSSHENDVVSDIDSGKLHTFERMSGKNNECLSTIMKTIFTSQVS